VKSISNREYKKGKIGRSKTDERLREERVLKRREVTEVFIFIFVFVFKLKNYFCDDTNYKIYISLKIII